MPCASREAVVDLGHRHERLLGDHNNVADEREHTSGADGRAVDGGDHRLGAFHHAIE